LPDAGELDELELAPEHRRAVVNAAREARELRSGGDRSGANNYAIESALSIIADLPSEQRDPRYAHRDPLRDVTDPDELAAHVGRVRGGF
jgi:hypothetical protein